MLNNARSTVIAMALLCLLGPVRSLALDPAKTVFQYNVQSWTLRESLPADNIRAIAQTQDGYLWFGTSKGLVRFDGTAFELIGLADDLQSRSRDVSSLAASKAGGLWVGIKSGPLGYYDGQRFAPVSKPGWTDPAMDVRSVREDSHSVVWVAAKTVTGCFEEGMGGGMSLGDNFPGGTSVGIGSQGRIWLGTDRHGLHIWQEGKVSHLADDSLDGSTVSAVAEDSVGQVWVGTEKGLICFDTSLHRKAIGDFPLGVGALLVDRHGVVWIGTSGGGLLCYKNGKFTSFRKPDGLVNDFVNALFEDREGSLWIGTRGGVSQITDIQFPTYSRTEGLPGGSCRAVAASRAGGIWAAVGNEFSRFDGKQAANYAAFDGSPNPFIKRVFEAKNGDIYLITGAKQVEIFSGGKIVASYPNHDWPSAFAEDSQGVVVGVENNLFRVSRSEFVPYSFTKGQAPQFVWIHNMFTGRDGSLWIASTNGIFRVKDGAYKNWSLPEGLSWDKVHCVFEDSDGILWAGLLTGIARLENNQIRNVTHANGLFDDFIFAMVPDDFGYFWVDSKRGIFRVSRQGLNDFCDGKTDHVECAAYDGPEMVKTVSKTDQEWIGCRSNDGRIWFPSPLGVVGIDPSNLRVNPVPPPVRIVRIRANGADLNKSAHSAIRHGNGNLEFQFTALSYVAPQRMQFRYQLEGYDHGWIEAGNSRSAAYSNLKPGRYVFRVIACNADGDWNTVGGSCSIELLPDFYQTVWFYLGCAALASAGLLKLYAWRVQYLRRRQRELEQARELLEARVKERTVELEAQKRHLEHEIEERKKLEEQFLQAQKMDAVGRLAAGIAHDFNNLLTVINGNASLLLSNESSASSETADCMQQIIEASERAASLTRQLLMFSRKQIIQPTPLDLNDVVAHMTKMLQRILGEDISLASNYASGLPAIHADAGMIEQILLNLAVNSRDAMPDGGRLTISTGTESLNEDLARQDPGAMAGLYVKLEVADTGSGIAPENLAHIFEPFFTTKEVGKGVGLGLATVYGIVKQHRGRIDVKSSLGKGTTFCIYIPAMTVAAPEKRATSKISCLERRTGTILFVEDELLVRLAVCNMMQHLGYTVLPAESGAKALALWQEHKDQIQVLLTDIVMPDGMSGYELARRLQANKQQLKVIYTSGYSRDLGNKRLELINGVNFLQKPFDPQMLAAALQRNLESK
jgi:signal transduction histidine kinase/ligand-binding sensor domain-containing protein/CheY-like chemotaxis protein